MEQSDTDPWYMIRARDCLNEIALIHPDDPLSVTKARLLLAQALKDATARERRRIEVHGQVTEAQ